MEIRTLLAAIIIIIVHPTEAQPSLSFTGVIQGPVSDEGSSAFNLGYGGRIKVAYLFSQKFNAGLSVGRYLYVSGGKYSPGSRFDRKPLYYSSYLLNFDYFVLPEARAKPYLIANIGGAHSQVISSLLYEAGFGLQLEDSSNRIIQFKVLYGSFEAAEVFSERWAYYNTHYKTFQMNYISIMMGVTVYLNRKRSRSFNNDES